MTTWVCLFRGINVGGKNVVPMKELGVAFADLGCEQTRTYIQSGNVVFRHSGRAAPELQEKIAAKIDRDFGFRPATVLLTVAQFQRIVEANPFPEALQEPKNLHAFFLAQPARTPDMDAIERLKSDAESVALREAVFYLHAPSGIGRSTLAQRAEKLLGVPTTARNWRTVGKLFELARETDR